MSRVASIICTMLFSAMMFGFISPVSAQIAPEVTLECNDQVEINPGPGSTRTAIVNCIVENPSAFSETIDITVDSGNLDSAAPGTLTVAAGESTNFEVIFKSNLAESAGRISTNVTATISQVNGVPYPVDNSESEEVIVMIIGYDICEVEFGQSGGTFDSGDEILILAAIICESNYGTQIGLTKLFQIHLIQENMGSSSWPNGFQNIDGDCNVEIKTGDSSENCLYRIGTPSDLGKDWEGCVVIIEEGEIRPNSCPNANKINLKINKKKSSLGIELGGNNSILEQLGITEEQVPVIAGSVGILILIIGGFIYYRRKGREYGE
ncbi:hypothetical protein OAV45_05025 [Candidatus Poseidoniales archaeon]|nr:hypothetical protein [Candidatus Poseidoniales archaeon]